MVQDEETNDYQRDDGGPEWDNLNNTNPKRIKKDTEFHPNSGELAIRGRKCHLYENKIILAPMVRANSLPFRLLCLKQGADLVYSEELIDHRVVTCRRVENTILGTIDLIDKDGKVIFRTCEDERNKIVFQLGSNDPERALKAAKLVSQDVMGLDFNFGCPKKFSIAGGMGAALLEEPEKIRALLTACVNELNIPVTCKMRILPKLEDTISLVKLIESCGVSAVAVHGRTKEQRPAHDNDVETLRIIAESISIPLIANGESNNIKTYGDIIKFRDKTKASAVMIGRIAMKNPAIFMKPEIICQPFVIKACDMVHCREPISMMESSKSQPDGDEASNKTLFGDGSARDLKSSKNNSNCVVREYLKLAVRYDNHPSNVKYTLQSLLSNGDNGGVSKGILAKLHRANSLEAICKLFEFSNQSKIKTLEDSSEPQ